MHSTLDHLRSSPAQTDKRYRRRVLVAEPGSAIPPPILVKHEAARLHEREHALCDGKSKLNMNLGSRSPYLKGAVAILGALAHCGCQNREGRRFSVWW